MDIHAYLSSLLTTCSQYALVADDQKIIDGKGIEEFIYHKLTSKKFRKWSLTKDAENRIKEAISINISNNQPIQYTFPFGGYKLWRLPTAPQVDWAEFFSIAYYAQYLAPISVAYKPGVRFFFSSDDVIVEQLDNIPVSDTKAYHASFNSLLAAFRKYFPSNFTMELVRIGDMYSPAEFEKELKKTIEKTKEVYTHMDYDKREKVTRVSELNITWNGAKNLTGLSEKEKKERIAFGPILHDAYCNLTKRREFVRGKEKIVIFPVPISNAIAIGTTKNSVTKFWTGIGVIEGGKDLRPRILSPQQWEHAKTQPCKTVKTNLIPLNNFKEIFLYDHTFTFSKGEQQ